MWLPSNMNKNAVLLENHICLAAENIVRSICNPTLAPVGITFFDYIRVYDNGECWLLSNDNRITQYLFEKKIPIIAPAQQEIITNKFWYFVLPMNGYQKPVHEVKAYFNLAHFINLVERYHGYVEMFCFGTLSTNEGILNFYLNNMDFLEKFKLFFMEKISALVKQCEKNRILLPANMLPPFKGTSCSEKAIDKKIKNNNPILTNIVPQVTLTKKQEDCLSLIIRGKTVKEIAKFFNLSPRTIDSHINALKSKLNCKYKSDIIEKVINIGLVKDSLKWL